MNKYIKKLFELFDTKGYQFVEYKDSEKVYIYYFEIGDNNYRCYIDNMLMGSYFLSFCLVRNDIENYKIMNDENIQKFKVLGTIKNIVDEFISKNDVEFLGYISEEEERRWIYLNFGKHISSDHNMNLFAKNINNKHYFWVVKKDINKLLLNKYVEYLMNVKRKK